MNPSIKNALGYVPAFLLIASGIAKLAGAAPVVHSLVEVHVEDYITILGILQIAIGVLFVLPATFKIAFYLSCAYFGGAAAVHLPVNELDPAPYVILAIIWVIAYLKKPSMFL